MPNAVTIGITGETTMTILKLAGVAGAVLLVLAVLALPVSAAGNQYSGTKDCPNCTGDCTPNDYSHEYLGPGPHSTQAGAGTMKASADGNGESILSQFQKMFLFQNMFQNQFQYGTSATV
jgi:hypothetical protein